QKPDITPKFEPSPIVIAPIIGDTPINNEQHIDLNKPVEPLNNTTEPNNPNPIVEIPVLPPVIPSIPPSYINPKTNYEEIHKLLCQSYDEQVHLEPKDREKSKEILMFSFNSGFELSGCKNQEELVQRKALAMCILAQAMLDKNHGKAIAEGLAN